MTNEKTAANIKRSASYRIALRRSAPVERDVLLTGADVDQVVDENNADNETINTSHPLEEKSVNGIEFKTEPHVIRYEPMIPLETNGENVIKSEKYDQEYSASEPEHGDHQCVSFCCHYLCCNYCNCCPNCLTKFMQRFEQQMNRFTNWSISYFRLSSH